VGKSGQEARAEIKAPLNESKACVVTQLDNAGKFSARKHEDIVNIIVDR
jgi:hypothetical protein